MTTFNVPCSKFLAHIGYMGHVNISQGYTRVHPIFSGHFECQPSKINALMLPRLPTIRWQWQLMGVVRTISMHAIC